MKLFIILFSLALLITGCTSDSNETRVVKRSSMPINRVIAKDYQVVLSSEPDMHCRVSPDRKSDSFALFSKGQKVSLLSVAEKGVEKDGDFWLHVYISNDETKICYVLAGILMPIPDIKK